VVGKWGREVKETGIGGEMLGEEWVTEKSKKS